MRQSSRPNAYLRHVENRWVSSESKFIDAEMFDACVDPEARRVLSDRNLEVYANLCANDSRPFSRFQGKLTKLTFFSRLQSFLVRRALIAPLPFSRKKRENNHIECPRLETQNSPETTPARSC